MIAVSAAVVVVAAAAVAAAAGHPAVHPAAPAVAVAAEPGCCRRTVTVTVSEREVSLADVCASSS